MKKNAAAGRTPSSLPVPTPPSLAMNVSSPKSAPLSAVHTKSINVSSDVPISHPEEDVSNVPTSLVVARMDRYQSAGAMAVPFETLDAMQELMKSVQAAAAAGSMDAGSRPLVLSNGDFFVQDQHQRMDIAEPDRQAFPPEIMPMDEEALSGLQARMERLKSETFEPL